MVKALCAIALLMIIACSKTKSPSDNMQRELKTTVVAVRNTTPYISNNWEVWMTFDRSVNMTGNIIVQHDLWDLGQFKKTYIDTFDFKIDNTNFYSWRTNRNANLQGPEIKNIKVNKFTQTSGNYTVTIK